jgi:ABC-2 type transport system permease protein
MGLLLIVLVVTQLSLGLNEVYFLEIRFWFFILVYALFYLITVSISVFLSFRLKNSVSVLILLLGIWVLWVLYLPFLSNSVATSLTSLPTRYEFVSAMKNDRSKGIDGHNPVQQRENSLLDSILTVYSVKTAEELPLNFDGLLMQADEDYGNKVWDKHFGALHQKRLSQKESTRWFDLVNPYAVVKRLSSGLAATDYIHYAHFEQQAEWFRRGFIKELNDKHAFGGSKTGDWSWKADSTFFASMKLFYYEVPEYSRMNQHYNWEFLLLAIFTCLSIGILFLPVLEEDFI